MSTTPAPFRKNTAALIAGKLRYQVVRFRGKQFKQRRPDGQGGWIWGLGDEPRLLFQLPKVKASGFVAVCEGEKDCETLDRQGIVATCNSGGAGQFRPELAVNFAGKDVGIFPDNDEPGRDHAKKAAALIAPVAKSVKIIELPDLPEKGDVTDFVNAGGTVGQIRELYRKAQPWTPEWEFATSVPDPNEQYVQTMEQAVEAAGGLTAFWDFTKAAGLPTPFSRLNWVLGGGMLPGEVYVIAGNQGAGKTSLGDLFALTALRKRYGVLIFSMEMNHRAVFQRVAAIEARVDLNALRMAQIHKEDTGDAMVRLSRATAMVAEWKPQVSTKPRVTPEYITAETKRIAKRHPIDLVIVDHAQLMNPDSSTRGEYERITAVSRALKITAGEVGVPLLLLSQTSRSNSHERRDLDLMDLRGSGALEEDAAAVFLLFEDIEDAKAARTEARDGKTRYMTGPVKTWLKVGKNRYGPAGAYLALNHFKTETRFEPIEREDPDGD